MPGQFFNGFSYIIWAAFLVFHRPPYFAYVRGGRNGCAVIGSLESDSIFKLMEAVDISRREKRSFLPGQLIGNELAALASDAVAG